jgi:hypothetical protein
MDFLTNETQINSATIITSLNKEESKKVYDYLVSVGAQKTDATLDLENLLSQYKRRCEVCCYSGRITNRQCVKI